MSTANGKRKYRKSDVYQRGNTTWTISYPVLLHDGSTRRKTKGGFNTEDAAKAAFDLKYDEYLAQKEQVYVEDPDITVDKYLVNWFENVYVRTIKSNTENPYRYTLYNYILPLLNPSLMLRNLKKSDLQDLFRKIGKMMPSYALKAKELFRVCLNTALDDNLVIHNAAERAKLPRIDHKKTIVPVPLQIKAMLDIASQTDTYLEFCLAITLGMRKGEIYGLKFSDINFDDRLLHINRQVTHDYIMTGQVESYAVAIERPPKNNSYRTLHIPEPIMTEIYKRRELIDNEYRRYSDFVDNDYVCGQQNGTARSGSCLNSALNSITKKLGMPTMAPHFLRHIAATIMFEQGIGIGTIANVLGHASIKTTYEIYIEVMTDREKMVKTMDELIRQGRHKEVA